MLYWPRPRSQKNLPRIAVSLLIVNLSLAATDRLNEAQDTPKFYQSAGTRKMAPLLQQIYAEEDWKTDPNKDGVRAQYYKQMLETKPDLQNELKIREAVAKCDLRAGDFADAVEQLEQIRRLGSKWVMIFDSSFEKDVRDSLGIAYLRLGEQENCLINHGRIPVLFRFRVEEFIRSCAAQKVPYANFQPH